MKLIKELLIPGLVVGGIYGAFKLGQYALRMNRLKKQASVVVRAKRPKLGLLSAQLNFEYVIKNPTEGRVEMSVPFARIKYKGQEIATTQLTPMNSSAPSGSSARIVIEKQSQTDPIGTELLVPYPSLPGLISDLASALGKRLEGGKDKVALDMEIVSTIYLGKLARPYNASETILI